VLRTEMLQIRNALLTPTKY